MTILHDVIAPRQIRTHMIDLRDCMSTLYDVIVLGQIRTHMMDLRDVTSSVHYENYRCRKLAGVGTDGKPAKVVNK